MTVYNTDNPRDIANLISKRLTPARMEYIPRREVYGSPAALSLGLEPVESRPDILLQPDQYRDALDLAHKHQTLARYHTLQWRPSGFRYNQDGLGYCWTWSGAGCLMTCRAACNFPLTYLAPVSMGYLVRWQNQGNYLASFIQGVREDGICPAPDNNVNSLNRDPSYWDGIGNRSKYRLDKVWDTDPRNMLQHCISILCYSRSLFVAYPWWGHAVELIGMRYNGNVLEWEISNSHNEPDPIILTGSKAVPGEAYAFVSPVFTE